MSKDNGTAESHGIVPSEPEFPLPPMPPVALDQVVVFHHFAAWRVGIVKRITGTKLHLEWRAPSSGIVRRVPVSRIENRCCLIPTVASAPHPPTRDGERALIRDVLTACAEYTLNPSDDGAPVTFLELIVSNSFDTLDLQRLFGLRVGEELTVGGGAMAETRVRRVK